MTTTLFGRIQTRIFLLAVVGGFWTAVLTPVLPGLEGSLAMRYAMTFMILATVTVLGVAWEFVYHFLQQFRWEKDWPTLFGLLNLINEGALVWFLLLYLDIVPFINGSKVSLAAYSILFLVVWIAQWLTANGPMRVPFIRWRFRGGRLV